MKKLILYKISYSPTI